MAHMALDHASLFWNARRFADEFWFALPKPADLPNFLARFSGFPVAPGFSFMAGFMVAVTSSARAARGDSETAIRNRLLVRAALLLGVELVCFSLATRRVQVGVLTCLGVCLAITAFVRRAPLPVLVGAALAILALHPLLLNLWTGRLDAAGVGIKALHQAGKFQAFDVYYPLIPWIGVMLLGVAAGRRYLERGPRDWPLYAGIFAMAFAITRGFGIGAAGPYETVFSYAFFTWSKYPPDLPWLAASFAVLFATLAILEKWQDHAILKSAPAEFIATFGRVPLFFYVLHFAILWATRPRELRDLPSALAAWIAVLLLLWWPCRAWHDYQGRRRNRFQTSRGSTPASP
jgi:uncharacterized membrane protein